MTVLTVSSYGLHYLLKHFSVDCVQYVDFRCANCFDCPCCMHTLSTRATNIPAPLPDDPTKTAMKKAYYLACGFCRWTSRDVGMADKSVGGSLLFLCWCGHVCRQCRKRFNIQSKMKVLFIIYSPLCYSKTCWFSVENKRRYLEFVID